MKKLCLLLLAVIALGGCKKDDNNSPAASSKTDLLTAKSWRVTARTNTSTFGNNPTSTTDEYATLPACERDNFTRFNTNKSTTYDEGSTKCDPADSQVYSGTWELYNDGAILTIGDPRKGGTLTPFDVLALSATTLQLRSTSSSSLGGTTVTFSSTTTFTAF